MLVRARLRLSKGKSKLRKANLILTAYSPPIYAEQLKAGPSCHGFWGKSTRRTSAGEIAFPHFGQTASRDACTAKIQSFHAPSAG
jgi:hypothetical protein